MASKPAQTYASSGVNYETMDPFKRMAQQVARTTSGNIARLDMVEVEASRGESAYLVDAGDHYLAHVQECLGTKNLVADAMHAITGRHYYDAIAQDSVAMIVNDLITMGALPISVAMYLAVGESEWFDDTERSQNFVDGWKRACDLARCVWGGGETPTLRDVIVPGAVDISGSAMGIVRPKSHLIDAHLEDGDAIVLLGSAGIHANGVTLARRIAERVGYDAKLSDGRLFGEALLDPTVIYVPVVDDCQREGIDLHYVVNVTGHGWRKLMRATQPFVYTIDRVPEPQPVFTFIQEQGPVDLEEMYGSYNMGAGFALFVPPADAERIVSIAARHGIEAWDAGRIARDGDRKALHVRPLDLDFSGDSLSIR